MENFLSDDHKINENLLVAPKTKRQTETFLTMEIYCSKSSSNIEIINPV